MKRKGKAEFYKSSKRGMPSEVWRWRAIGSNGRILGRSSEGYGSLRDAIKGFKATIRALSTLTWHIPPAK